MIIDFNEEWKKIAELHDNKYGDDQLIVVLEECSELQKAICKYIRVKEHPELNITPMHIIIENLIEEMYDTYITLEFLKVILEREWKKLSIDVSIGEIIEVYNNYKKNDAIERIIDLWRFENGF